MMMDEDMEDMDGVVFTVHEIDLEYEFDACKFVDFCEEESFAEARKAEMWFESAPDYPPSPFVAKLKLGDMSFLENVNVSPKGGGDESTTLHNNQSSARQMPVLDSTARGLTFYNHLPQDAGKVKPKPRIKPTLPRKSTLMKPTASQLAKQNKPHQTFSSRFNMPQVHTSDKSVNNSSGNESQAPKRQKLDGGQLHKIVDLKQPSPLVHKPPKKDGITDFKSNAKLKLTIPREPEFVASQRVQLLRSRSKTKPEEATPTAYSFRARPLNRKILEAPSMPPPRKSTPRPPEFKEFHLKTAERSAQHASAVQSPSLQCSNIRKAALSRPSHCYSTSERDDSYNGRSHKKGASQQDERGTSHTFKALPVNKKIFSSKGELGVSRSIKRNVTIPMEFKFETEKRTQQYPPVDLFSKLSLASELQPTNGNEKLSRLSRLTFATTKGPKENRFSSQLEHEMTNTDRTPRFWPDHLHCCSDRIAVETGTQSGRWLGIR